MANTIRIGTFEVSSFKVGLKDPKIYLGDILLYPTGGYKVCYAVVEDITQYIDREYEDVYDKATEKWYKLNNLNQYEEYGIYGSGRTSCEGSTSRLPQGYTEVECIENTGTSYIDTNFKPNTNTRIIADMQQVTANDYPRLFGCDKWNDTAGMNVDYEGGYLQICWFGKTSWTQITSVPNNFDRHIYDLNKNNLYVDEILVASTTYSSSYQSSGNLGIFIEMIGGRPSSSSYWSQEAFKGKMYSFKVYDNGTLVRDLVPCIKDSDNTVGAYDIVNNVFYTVPTGYTTDKLIAGGSVTPTDCVTTYNGKLTIDDGYEYEWNGSSWVNVGEVTGTSITIKSPDYIEKDSSHGGKISLDYVWKTNTKMQFKFYSTNNGGGGIIGEDGMPDNNDCRLFFASTNAYFDYGSGRIMWSGSGRTNTLYEYEYGNYYIKNMVTGAIKTGAMFSTDRTNQLYFGQGGSDRFRAYYLKIYEGDTLVKDFIPWTDMNGNYGLFDKVSLSVYNVVSGSLTGSSNVTDVEVGSSIYPKYYSEKSEPLDNLTFNTLVEAQAYAEANCVYDGMHAIIDGDRYYFDSTDEDGWVKVTEYYIVEDVTSGGASGWTIIGSSTYNPQPSYYDDFSVALNSSYQTKVAKVTIYGYENFTYYLRSTGYSSYAYATSSNVDELTSDPTSMSYSSSSAITNTYNFNKAAGSAVNLSNYRRVTYNNLDKTVEHTFYVVFYNGYYYSSYPPSATLLIPKEQTNENWEQVTFSASSNVASSQKSLYIDGNNSTSGGTQYWYYRWMVGLPSGSHNSYTNNSYYEYCPNVTSSTFTSVAGKQRQINFTYDYVSNKGLSFRLTDGSNVLTPSNTVYYNMTYYNSCGVSSSSNNVTFPRSLNVKVGGRFRFGNSSNRHYIYGYSPNISLNYDYYVDNYQDIFDITYTKLNDEAVTITYTTYDPSDVETPAFKTDITWPYSGGTTSSTTLTLFDVPYTYPYEVSQTNDKFSADSQSYTAGQAARTINFVLYPNNREFATVADLEVYQYAWEGMKATVGDRMYQYKNGEWVEQVYTQYEYIRTQNSSAAYYNFNTNFYPTTANTFEVKVEFVDRSIDWGAIILWRPGSSSNFEFDTVTSSYQAIVRTGGSGDVAHRPTIGANNPTVYTLPLSAQSGTYSINGGPLQTIQYNYNTMTLPSSRPMGIFGDAVGKDLKGAVAKLYYIKVYDGNGNIAKHYVPSDSNGTPCFYEIVDGDYILNTYTGSDKGTCTLGPVI